MNTYDFDTDLSAHRFAANVRASIPVLARCHRVKPSSVSCSEAGSLAEARREAAEKAERIDLAVVDLLLPDGIGTELIRDLRADGSGVPVLVLTVATGPDLRAWVRSMGADEMISKDASVDEILAAIRVLLRG